MTYLEELHASFQRDGFTLMAEAKPALGHSFEAVRIMVNRGFGGVVLSTGRKIVPVTRTGDYEFHDTLNDERCAYSAFDAWWELQTYKTPDEKANG